MAARKQRQQIITFKVDESLSAALDGIRNRSEFIRAAILASLNSTCPLCNGTGILSANQKQHWDAFAADHALRECRDCHERHLVCAQSGKPRVHHG